MMNIISCMEYCAWYIYIYTCITHLLLATVSEDEELSSVSVADDLSPAS